MSFDRSTFAREMARRPEVRAKISASAKLRHGTPEGRANQRAKALATHADPVKRAKWHAAVTAANQRRALAVPDWMSGAADLHPLYRNLRARSFSAAEAKVMILDLIAKRHAESGVGI